MYLRRLFRDSKKKLVYSNGPSQGHLSYQVNDGSNMKAYKNRDTKNAGYSRKLPWQILQNSSSKSLASKK